MHDSMFDLFCDMTPLVLSTFWRNDKKMSVYEMNSIGELEF